jgi:hypothetical protein
MHESVGPGDENAPCGEVFVREDRGAVVHGCYRHAQRDCRVEDLLHAALPNPVVDDFLPGGAHCYAVPDVDV